METNSKVITRASFDTIVSFLNRNQLREVYKRVSRRDEEIEWSYYTRDAFIELIWKEIL